MDQVDCRPRLRLKIIVSLSSEKGSKILDVPPEAPLGISHLVLHVHLLESGADHGLVPGLLVGAPCFEPIRRLWNRKLDSVIDGADLLAQLLVYFRRAWRNGLESGSGQMEGPGQVPRKRR